jgi:putative transposase
MCEGQSIYGYALRESEVELARGQATGEVCRKLVISEQTCYRWRRMDGGLKVEEGRKLKSLEEENSRLKRVVAEQSLDIAILKETASGNR